MNTFRFKTNISCSGCVAALKPHFQRANEFDSWKVDLNDFDKTLTVSGKNLDAGKVIRLVEEVGFIIQEK